MADSHIFRTEEYGCQATQCEVRENGKWSRATVYEHKATGSVVLWFGGTKYEGIGANYHWGKQHVTRGAQACMHGRRQLLDGDGSPITTKPCAPLMAKVTGDLEVKTSSIPGAGDGLFTTRAFVEGEEVLHLSGDVVWIPENRQALTKAGIPAPAGQMVNHHSDVNLMEIVVWVDPDPSIPGSTKKTATACMRPGPGDIWVYFNHSEHANVELSFGKKVRGEEVGGCTTHDGRPVYLQGKFQPCPAPPYYPVPRGKIHTRGNAWSFTVG